MSVTAYGTYLTSGSYHDYYIISGISTSIPISPYYLPVLRKVTFNSLSFYDRIARIGDSKIEYYMVFRPSTTLINLYIEAGSITSIVFRLPGEFLYPSIINLNNC